MNCTHQNKEDRHARDRQRSVCHRTHNAQGEKDAFPKALPANVQHGHTMQVGEEGGQGRESAVDIQRPACSHTTCYRREREGRHSETCLLQCHATLVAMPYHAARTKEVTLGPASHSYVHPTVGATTMYKYVGGQIGKKEKQNNWKIMKRNEAEHVGVERNSL